jgi:hypothetical protein
MRTRLIVGVIVLVSNLAAVGQVREAATAASSLRHDMATDGDPFYVGTGVYYREYTDLLVKDTIPINFVRTQRNMDPESRSFGIGASSFYDIFIIGDVKQFSWVALVYPNGMQARFNRISPGTSYSNGVFEYPRDDGEFSGGRITWNGNGAWIVRLRDGTQYTIHGCKSDSKPGQCAVIEIKNGQGERLLVQRDLQGRLHKITSPHGHFIDIQTDSAGHILKAQDDFNNWVSYVYDKNGCLIGTNNWRQDHQEFLYDAKFNMTYLHEWGPLGKDGRGPYDFNIRNRFDAQNRLAYQRVSTGDTWSAKYVADAQGHIRQTAVSDKIGVARYFFDEAGYAYREQYEIANQKKWVLDYAFAPHTRKLTNVALTCSGIKKNMPLKFADEVEAMGDSHKTLISNFCRQSLKRVLTPTGPPKNGL